MKVEREEVELRTGHPHYGEIIKNPDGTLVCHICGKSFRKLGSHAYMTHGITSREYKIMFGLDVQKGLVTDEHRAELSDLNRKHFDLVVRENLIEGGKKTRFKKNSPGRLKSMVSEQTQRKIAVHGRRVLRNTKFHKIHQQRTNDTNDQ